MPPSFAGTLCGKKTSKPSLKPLFIRRDELILNLLRYGRMTLRHVVVAIPRGRIRHRALL
jgi:hypothetical protein